GRPALDVPAHGIGRPPASVRADRGDCHRCETPQATPRRRAARPPRTGPATASGTPTDAAEGPARRTCDPTADRTTTDLLEGAAVAWSTSELAHLAGTTARTVRHYHDVGLLEEPRR